MVPAREFEPLIDGLINRARTVKGKQFELIDEREAGLRIRAGERSATWSLCVRLRNGKRSANDRARLADPSAFLAPHVDELVILDKVHRMLFHGLADMLTHPWLRPVEVDHV